MSKKIKKCKECSWEYPDGCEQAVAIDKRDKCICCLHKDGEFKMGGLNIGKTIDGVFHYHPDYEFIPKDAKILPSHE